jgi:signal transduction histidine kinase
MFNKARLKLTAWYLLIIVVICLFFTIPTYKLLTHEVERFSRVQRFRIEEGYRYDRPTPPPITEDLVKETKDRIVLQLIALNSLIIIISGGLAYFLAGKTLQPIKEMIAEQYRFVSDSSHELRTPITSLKTAIEVSLRSKTDSVLELQNTLRENLSDVNRLQSLTDKLLRLAQIDQKKIPLSLTSVNLKTVSKIVTTQFKNLFQTKNINLKNKVSDLIVVSSQNEIQEILSIFLENAWKYSKENTRVQIDSKKLNGHVYISVSDQGVGIKKKDLPHIFDRFFRSDNVRSLDGSSGYGLGLSIAKKIASDINGEINVSSKYKKGSIFTLKLPVSFS